MQINFFKLSKSTKIHRNDTLQFNLPKQTHKSNQFNLSSPFLCHTGKEQQRYVKIPKYSGHLVQLGFPSNYRKVNYSKSKPIYATTLANYDFTRTEISGKNEEFGGSGKRSFFGGGAFKFPNPRGGGDKYFRGGSKSQKVLAGDGVQEIR